MGHASSSSREPRPPPPPLQRPAEVPIGVIPGFTVHTEQIVLKLEEKRLSFSGDDFYITDAFTGETVLGCMARSFSLSQKKEFVDAQNALIFRLEKQALSFRGTFLGTAAHDENQLLFTVKSSFGFGGASISTTFVNAADGRNLELCLVGDFFNMEAIITLGEGGPAIATISRDYLNTREMFSGQQTYFLTVAPGVDVSLLSALCVCLDEIRNDNRR
ncbi:tubby C-terminal-like domain-containing protein [Pterulicium gracile]|uniref:Tubby C-terminal-like domain-containing protein n=1 Tax=Pterulicium gracile TaxID=1884261 RepID=A0A5C3QPA4_9AGAR|nr:tubby C-terminal-like domain-containing protein [Pterula gracilis]